MAFAPGMSVFPGGGVDPVDADGPARHGRPSPSSSVSPEHAAVLLRAAVGEIGEETGVRLAGGAAAVGALDHPRGRTAPLRHLLLRGRRTGRGARPGRSDRGLRADWIPVAEALAEYDRGERPMLPPTVVNLSACRSSRRRPSAGVGRRPRLEVVQPACAGTLGDLVR